MTVVIVDCGMGNLHSVAAAARKAAPRAAIKISAVAADIDSAQKVIFPGDGHFNACMLEIDRRGLRAALRRAAREKPFFGVCVGMQVLYESSEEGAAAGLGVFGGRVRRFSGGGKVPHMGWNTVRRQGAHPIFHGVEDDAYFYFIHSYYAPAGEWTIATAEYGGRFAAINAKDKLLASQFHPEKSGRQGLRLLRNFLREG